MLILDAYICDLKITSNNIWQIWCKDVEDTVYFFSVDVTQLKKQIKQSNITAATLFDLMDNPIKIEVFSGLVRRFSHQSFKDIWINCLN